MSKTVTYGNIKYNCKTLTEYKIEHVNRKSDEKIIDDWKFLFVDYFNRKDLSNDIIISLGRLVEEYQTSGEFVSPLTQEKMEKLDALLKNSKPSEHLKLYYMVFESIKLRQMKINKILNI